MFKYVGQVFFVEFEFYVKFSDIEIYFGNEEWLGGNWQ